MFHFEGNLQHSTWMAENGWPRKIWLCMERLFVIVLEEKKFKQMGKISICFNAVHKSRGNWPGNIFYDQSSHVTSSSKRNDHSHRDNIHGVKYLIAISQLVTDNEKAI